MKTIDCIIVLANEMDKEGNLNAESTARAALAYSTYLKFPEATLIACGWNYRKDTPLKIGDVIKEYLVKLGVPPEKILSNTYSRDTVGDAFFTKIHEVKSNGFKNIVVVTSDYHVARTKEIFSIIYGPTYHIEVFGAGQFDSPEKQNLEKKSLEALHHTFQGVKHGDDKTLLDRLITRHPFYNGQVYSKIDVVL